MMDNQNLSDSDSECDEVVETNNDSIQEIILQDQDLDEDSESDVESVVVGSSNSNDDDEIQTIDIDDQSEAQDKDNDEIIIDDRPNNNDRSVPNFSISLADHITEYNKDKIREPKKFVERKGKFWFCKKCGVKNVRESYLILHAEIHVDGLLFGCKVCNKKYPTRIKLRDHHEEFHSHNSTPVNKNRRKRN